MNTVEALTTYASDFSVKVDTYNDASGKLILVINNKKYRTTGVPVRDYVHFRRLLGLNRGRALEFLKKTYTIERIEEPEDIRPSDEAFDAFIQYMSDLVPSTKPRE